MQLHRARLCLDCDEVHDAGSCPVCGSEAFAYLTRWVPDRDRHPQPRPTTSPEADVYRELLAPVPEARPTRSLLKSGVLGVAAVAMAGWVWRRSAPARNDTAPPDARTGREDGPRDAPRDPSRGDDSAT